MNSETDKCVEEILQLVQTTFKDNPNLTQETGETNVKGQQTIEMDKKVEEVVLEYIKKSGIAADVFSEEIGMVKFHPNPKYLIAFDPLDGSTNYRIGKNFLPYGFLIAIFNGLNPKMSDVVSAGAIEHSQKLAWIYKDDETYDSKGKKVQLRNDWENSKRTPFYLDLYYKEGYKAYENLPGKIFVRNTGSTIGNLTYTLELTSAGLGHVCMRPEEVGAVYALINGAKGIAINHAGQDLGELPFFTDRNYEILAGSPNVVNFVRKQLIAQ